MGESVAVIEVTNVNTHRSSSTLHSAAHEHEKASKESLCSRGVAWFWGHFLPVGLTTLLVFGAVFPPPGEYLNDTELSKVLVAIIFFISGLNLQTDQIRNAFSNAKAVLYGVVAILFITPLVAFPVTVTPVAKDFRVGLAIFCTMPTTLSSGVVFTRISNGNVALSLLLTVTTNVLSVLTIPFMLPFVTSEGTDSLDVSLSPGDLMLKLALLILVPISIGKALQYKSEVAAFATTHKPWLKRLSIFCLILIPWMKISAAVDDFSQVGVGDVFAMIGLGILIHLVYLAVNLAAARLLLLDPEATRAVVLMTSEKTLATAVVVLDFLPASAGEPGIILLAIITAHFSQIMIDAAVANKWAKEGDTDSDNPITDSDKAFSVAPPQSTEPHTPPSGPSLGSRGEVVDIPNEDDM